MRRSRPIAAAIGALLLGALPARAELTTSIDLDYAYEQRHEAEDVEATATYRQKYEVKSEAFLGGFDFAGAARLELEDTWETDAAGKSRVAPTLEVALKNGEASVKLAYQAVIGTTDLYEEEAESETYSTNTTADFQFTPYSWPEFDLKLQRRRELDLERKDALTRTAEFRVRKDFSGLLLEYDFKREWVEDTLPERGTRDAADSTGKVTYKDILWWDAEFELSYEIGDSYSRETDRGVFTADDEAREHKLKTRIQKSLQLTPRMSLKGGWEFNYDEDLLGLDYESKSTNKYQAQLRYDPVSALKLTADFKRELTEDRNRLPEDDEQGLSDNVTLAADLEPFRWLRISSKADVKWDEDVKDGTGASVDRRRQETYETILRTRFGGWWEMTLNGANSLDHEDGWLVGREAKFRGEVKLTPFQDVLIVPDYEVIRTTDWDARAVNPDGQKQTRAWKIKFDLKRQLLDLLRVAFVHEYGLKTTDELDAALVFDQTVELNEDTKFSLTIDDLIDGLKIEGEVNRRASDTEDDGDPMIVDVSYAVKLEYMLEPFAFSSSFKYNDKGDTFDDLVFNAKLEWKTDMLALSGEYQFDKVYADETDETRKMNLKLSYKF